MTYKKVGKIAGLALGVLLLFTAVIIFYPQNTWPFVVNLDTLIPPAGQYNARILRDEWGVPHIFGRTDADAAYGLAFANAEDDFGTIQDTMLASRGMLGQVYGRDSAPIDYFVHLLRIWDDIDAQYETIPPETRAVLTAYAAGLNHYAALHPDEVATPDLLPITGQDITAGFMLKVPVFFGLDSAVGELFEPPEENQRLEIGDWRLAMGNLQSPISQSPISQSPISQSPISQSPISQSPISQSPISTYGSNVFAVSPARSVECQQYAVPDHTRPGKSAGGRFRSGLWH